MQVLEKILQEIEGESNLAHEEMRRCSAENSLQFDDAKGYARGMSTALEIIRSHMEDDTENEPVSNPNKLDDGWIPVGRKGIQQRMEHISALSSGKYLGLMNHLPEYANMTMGNGTNRTVYLPGSHYHHHTSPKQSHPIRNLRNSPYMFPRVIS